MVAAKQAMKWDVQKEKHSLWREWETAYVFDHRVSGKKKVINQTWLEELAM